MAIRFQLYRAYADDPRASSSHSHTRENQLKLQAILSHFLRVL